MALQPIGMRGETPTSGETQKSAMLFVGAGALLLLIGGIWAWTRVKQQESPSLETKAIEPIASEELKNKTERLRQEVLEAQARSKKVPEEILMTRQADLEISTARRIEEIEKAADALEPHHAVETVKELQTMAASVPALQPRIDALSPQIKRQATPKKMRIKVTTLKKSPVQIFSEELLRLKKAPHLPDMEKLYLQLENFLEITPTDQEVGELKSALQQSMVELLKGRLEANPTAKEVEQIEQSAKLISAKELIAACHKMQKETILVWAPYQDEDEVYNASHLSHLTLESLVEQLGWAVNTEETTLHDFLDGEGLLTVGSCRQQNIATIDQLVAHLKQNTKQYQPVPHIEKETPIQSGRRRGHGGKT